MDQGHHDHAPEVEETPAAIRAAMKATRNSLGRNLHALKDRLLHPFAITHTSKDALMPTGGKSKIASKSPKSEGKKKPGHGAESKATGRTVAAGAGDKDAKTKSDGAARQTNGAAKTNGAAGKAGKKEHDSRKTKPRSKAASSRTGASKKTRAKESMISKTGEALDTMVAGAVVGAITGAARNLAGEPTAVPLCEPATSGEASGEAGIARLTSESSRPGGEAPSTGEVLGEVASGAALGAISGAVKAVMNESGVAASSGKSKKKKAAR
ncbi:MAG: DUF3618 domain-containing protein [Isosphaeraceae bacterium]